MHGDRAQTMIAEIARHELGVTNGTAEANRRPVTMEMKLLQRVSRPRLGRQCCLQGGGIVELVVASRIDRALSARGAASRATPS